MVTVIIVTFVKTINTEGTEIKKQESVLDKHPNIEKMLTLDIPKVPRLCDSMDIDKQNINIENCKLYCEQEGSGIPVVLINGGPGGTHHCFHPHFSAAGEFARIIYYDQRGCGLSDHHPGKGYSVDQAIDDLDKLRKALNIKKWLVLGWSYGGTLAQNYVTKYPQHVKGLVLVSSATYGLPVYAGSRQLDYMSREELKRQRQIWQKKSLSAKQKLFNVSLNGDWKRQNFYRPTKKQLAHMVHYEWNHDPCFRKAICKDLDKKANTNNLVNIFKNCPIPVMIIEGKWDLTWDASKLKKFYSCFPKAELAIFEKSGHGPFMDEPQAFFRKLKTFIQQLQPIPESAITAWKQAIVKQQQENKNSPTAIINSSNYSAADNVKLATRYKNQWLSSICDPAALTKLGLALYEAKKYEDALKSFTQAVQLTENLQYAIIPRIWQGHILDLLGHRKKAIAVYQQIADRNINAQQHQSQYNFTFIPSSYAAQRTKEPFTRLENINKK